MVKMFDKLKETMAQGVRKSQESTRAEMIELQTK